MDRRCGTLVGLALSCTLLAACRQPDTSLVALPTTSWPTNGGNWYNQRHSPLTQIDRGNVATLKGVWRTQLGGSGVGPQYSGEAQPLVIDGVVYVPTGASDLFALDVTTGAIL
ncbi:MAG TPA: PQQ-binding-like beta-propeller repeat protein, partial [Gammaproteobacteria bacterium]|nr:PQQ-binding-like beta-propeller repeat protein [Gammaproteobacteria bacterium]